MIRKAILIGIILFLGGNMIAQNTIERIAREVVSNNLIIQALSLENQVRSLENKQGLFPEDPELNYGHLWGSPSLIGNRTDLNVTQRIKFPNYYSKKKKLNKLSLATNDMQLDIQANQVLFELLDILLDMSYIEETELALNERIEGLTKVLDLSEKKSKAGETNRMETEKIQLLVDSYVQDLGLILTEKRILEMRLKKLNADKTVGGGRPAFSDFDFLKNLLPERDSFASSPNYQMAMLNTEMAVSEIDLAKNDRLPDLMFGYMSEKINGEKLAGLEMGLSIPIWGKSNKIKQARIRKDMYDKKLLITKQLIQSEWDIYSERASRSLAIKTNLGNSLENMKTKYLLRKSYELGEISLHDYLLELPFFYGVEDRVLEANRMYYKSLLAQNKNWLSDLILN